MSVYKKIIFVVIAFFLAYAASRVFTIRTGVIEQAVSYATYPVLLFQHHVIRPIHKWFEKRSVMHEIFDNYQTLYKDRGHLLAENIKLKALLNYQKSLHELLDFKQRYRTDYAIAAQVLLKHFDDAHHFYFIDKGSRHTIAQDMMVVYKNCLVGRIVEVYPWYSKVLLITDHTCKIPALCASTGARGIYQGLNKLDKTHLEFVSHLETIKKGDMILSHGEGLVFPKGFALGCIASAEKDGLHYQITVRPLIDLKEIEQCYIIQKGAEYIT